MISRKKLEKTAEKFKKTIPSIINVLDLEDFIDHDAINSYNGRIKFILKRTLTKKDFIIFRTLCTRLTLNKFINRFKGRISVRLITFSSEQNDHVLTIDNIEYTLIGSENQFMSQFGIIRENKLKDLLS